MRDLEQIAALNREAAETEAVNARRSSGLCAIELRTGLNVAAVVYVEPEDAARVMTLLANQVRLIPTLLPTLSSHGLTRDQSEDRSGLYAGN